MLAVAPESVPVVFMEPLMIVIRPSIRVAWLLG
jgi:hypothetical protein